MVRIAVLVSGGGTNLQALIDAQSRGELKNGRIAAVLSSRPDAYALERAERRAARAAALARREQAASAPGELPAQTGGWTGGGEAPAAQTGGAGELETALRVDRAFRRDSRRYDGGFFLY